VDEVLMIHTWPGLRLSAVAHLTFTTNQTQPRCTGEAPREEQESRWAKGRRAVGGRDPRLQACARSVVCLLLARD
jgi:hypothetical protein